MPACCLKGGREGGRQKKKKNSCFFVFCSPLSKVLWNTRLCGVECRCFLMCTQTDLEREESFIQVSLGRAEQRPFLSLSTRHTVLFLCLIFILKICFLCDFFNAQLGIEGILWIVGFFQVHVKIFTDPKKSVSTHGFQPCSNVQS